jgi:hypothetical protein
VVDDHEQIDEQDAVCAGACGAEGIDIVFADYIG